MPSDWIPSATTVYMEGMDLDSAEVSTQTRTHTRARAHTHTHARAHAHAHTHARARARTHIHTHTHTHTYTHTAQHSTSFKSNNLRTGWSWGRGAGVVEKLLVRPLREYRTKFLNMSKAAHTYFLAQSCYLIIPCGANVHLRQRARETYRHTLKNI